MMLLQLGVFMCVYIFLTGRKFQYRPTSTRLEMSTNTKSCVSTVSEKASSTSSTSVSDVCTDGNTAPTTSTAPTQNHVGPNVRATLLNREGCQIQNLPSGTILQPQGIHPNGSLYVVPKIPHGVTDHTSVQSKTVHDRTILLSLSPASVARVQNTDIAHTVLTLPTRLLSDNGSKNHTHNTMKMPVEQDNDITIIPDQHVNNDAIVLDGHDSDVTIVLDGHDSDVTIAIDQKGNDTTVVFDQIVDNGNVGTQVSHDVIVIDHDDDDHDDNVMTHVLNNDNVVAVNNQADDVAQCAPGLFGDTTMDNFLATWGDDDDELIDFATLLEKELA